MFKYIYIYIYIYIYKGIYIDIEIDIEKRFENNFTYLMLNHHMGIILGDLNLFYAQLPSLTLDSARYLRLPVG